MQIQNPDVTRLSIEQANLTLSEGVPQNLLPNVQPVLDVSPDFHRIGRILGGGTGTLFTFSATRKTFITGILMSYTKTAADTGVYMRIACTIDGQAQVLAYIGSITLTADARTVYIPFNTPVLIDKGTTVSIALSGTYTERYAIAHGYEV